MEALETRPGLGTWDGLVILGPTATGKTRLAAEAAARLDGEIISADSRQVFRGMDLGTGKDEAEYTVRGRRVPVHLIDIRDPGEEYSVFEFQQDAFRCLVEIRSRGRFPILCGGTGLYLESVLKGYRMWKVPRDPTWRARMERFSTSALVRQLRRLKSLHNTTDTADRDRVLRALEIERHRRRQAREPGEPLPFQTWLVAGIHFPPAELRQRIRDRLEARIRGGLVDEVAGLLRAGVTAERLGSYGLEYRYITAYLQAELQWDETRHKLDSAIANFAKRQRSWFRRMERHGIPILWLKGSLSTSSQCDALQTRLATPRENHSDRNSLPRSANGM